MLSEVRTLVLLAQEGSIQKVAERLPLTQPAVTRQIQRLEQALGVELLDRRQKPPGLTPAGVEAVARSRRILADFEDMRQMGRRGEPSGPLRLGIANGLADDRFAAIVSGLRGHYPRVSLRLTTGWSLDLSEKLQRGHLDAAVVLSSERMPNGAPDSQESLAIVASIQNPTKELSPADLARHEWILSPEPCDARRRLAEEMKRHRAPLQIAAETQDPRLQIALVREGMGLGLMPRRLLRAQPKGIKAVKVSWIDLTLAIHIERSPYLHNLAPVVDHVAINLRAAS